MIAPICDGCGEELTEFGAILLSPPTTAPLTNVTTVAKLHLCVRCFDYALEQLDIDFYADDGATSHPTGNVANADPDSRPLGANENSEL